MSKTPVLPGTMWSWRDAPSADRPRSRQIPPRTWPQPLHWRRQKWAQWTRQTLVPNCEISSSMLLLRKHKQHMHMQRSIIRPHIMIWLITLMPLLTRCCLRCVHKNLLAVISDWNCCSDSGQESWMRSERLAFTSSDNAVCADGRHGQTRDGGDHTA